MAGDAKNPGTLAGLWVKPKGSPRATPRAQPDPQDETQEQLGLLFSEPAAVPLSQATRVGGYAPVQRTTPPAAAPSAGGARRVWTVRALISDLRQQVESSYADLWVEGEISNCRPAASGHMYFTLKDGDAQLPVVLFRRQAQLLRFRPQDGLAVLARGRISVFEARGQLQLIADTLEPRGAGALQLAYEQLRDKLKAEGLFDAERKRPLPAFPHCVGVITSTGGAVLHDIIKVVRRRHARLNLLIYPALMQGYESSRNVAAGVRFFNANPGKADVILIARGGGSPEDLAGFNDEALARAIAASRLPIVSAIGHETDFTIADFVADLRAPTPSAAAELITAAQHRIEEHVAALDTRVRRAVRYQLVLGRQKLAAVSVAKMEVRLQALLGRRGQTMDDLRHRIESAAARELRGHADRLARTRARLERQHPAVRLASARERTERAVESLRRLFASSITLRATRMDRASTRLAALSPLAVLSRGYALVYRIDPALDGGATLLRDASDAAAGQRIRARLATGSVDAEITDVRGS